MIEMSRLKLKKRRGAALVWVLFVFVILTIFTSTMLYLQRQNILEAARQEERLQTYYIALAGVDLTYAAILEANNNESRVDASILDKIGTGSLNQDILIKTDDIERGTANVTIERTQEIIDGKTVYWIRITSIGQLKDKDVKVTSIMRINERRITQIVRET